jgi:disulfide bond formation protein DsbB
MNINIFNQILSLGTILIQILIVVLIISLILNYKKINDFFYKKASVFSLLLVLSGTLLSLFYSNIIGYEPCELCWYQRIFLYPQLILFSLALIRKNKDLETIYNSLIFSILGGVVAGYQYFLQLGILPNFCSANNISCEKIFFKNFGYITMPMMALTIFIFIIILNIIQIKYLKESLS